MAEFGKLNFSVSFNPTSGFPLDARYYFDTLAAAQEAAAAAVEVGSSDGTYFYGMNLVVVESGEATMYVIQPNKTLKPVGTTPVGDNKSIVVSPEGTIALKGIEDAETGMYPAVGADGSIEWKAFDTSTTDGLTQSVNQLKGQMTAAEGEIDALQTAVGDSSSGLVKQVNDLSTNLTTNYYDKEAVDGLISGAFHFKGAADSYDGTDIIIDDQPLTGMKTGDVYQVGDKEYVYDGTKWIELGFNIDLSNYALKTYVDSAVSGAKTELQGYADQAEADALQAAKTYADTQDGTTLTSAKSYADAEIAKLTDPSTGILKQAKDYADQAETDAIAAAGTAADQKIAAAMGTVEGGGTLKQYVDTQLATKANTVHTHTISQVTDAGTLAALDEVGEANLAAALKTKIDGKADKATTLAGYGITDAMTSTAITGAISTAKDEAVDSATAAAGTAADSKIAAKVGEIGAVTVKQYVDTQISENAYDDSTLAGRVTTVEGQISAINNESTGILKQAKDYADAGLAGKANTSHTHTLANITDAGDLAAKDQVAEADLESTLAAKINAKADTTALTALQGEVDTLEGTVATKANASEVYTKGEADGKIAAAVAGASHLKRTIVDALPDAGEADENTIYMVAKSGDTGDRDGYDEYFVIEGAWEKIGDTVVDLTEYAKTSEVTSAIGAAKTELQTNIDKKVDKVAGSRLMTDTEGTKLAGIEEAAEVNIIESITAGGEALQVNAKAVALPLATAAKVGLVKVDNSTITVTGDGTIAVNQVNLNQVQQTAGDVLILNCGNSVKS